MKLFFQFDRIFIFLCSIFLSIDQGNAAGKPSIENSIAGKLHKFEMVEKSHFRRDNVHSTQIPESIPVAYERLFYLDSRLPELKNLKQSELERLFAAARSAAFYSGDEKHARDLARIFQHLEKFGVPKKTFIARLLDALLVTRLIDDAKTLGQKYPFAVIEPLPDFKTEGDIPDGSTTEWVVSQTSRTLTRRVVNLEKGAQVIVLSHPFCHFSRNAHQAISADPELVKLMQPHTKWLVPQNPGFVFDPIQKWNAQYQNTAMTIAYSRKEWPSITEWSTPVFYFYKDGALVTSFMGWPKEGNMSQLKNSLKMIGLE